MHDTPAHPHPHTCMGARPEARSERKECPRSQPHSHLWQAHSGRRGGAGLLEKGGGGWRLGSAVAARHVKEEVGKGRWWR